MRAMTFASPADLGRRLTSRTPVCMRVLAPTMSAAAAKVSPTAEAGEVQMYFNASGVATVFPVWGLTFELSGRQRQDARPGPVKMYRVPPARAWWPAVGAPLERGVRPQRAGCE